jgi:hypothetical protein
MVTTENKADVHKSGYFGAPEVPICELVDSKGLLLRCAAICLVGGVGMVKPVILTKSVRTKVSEEEYARLEEMAGGRALSEWIREVLLRELDGRQARPAEQTLLAEVIALRTIVANVVFYLVARAR